MLNEGRLLPDDGSRVTRGLLQRMTDALLGRRGKAADTFFDTVAYPSIWFFSRFTQISNEYYVLYAFNILY